MPERSQSFVDVPGDSSDIFAMPAGRGQSLPAMASAIGGSIGFGWWCWLYSGLSFLIAVASASNASARDRNGGVISIRRTSAHQPAVLSCAISRQPTLRKIPLYSNRPAASKCL